MGQYKCCCCFPLRAGVLTIALLSAAVYIALTVGLFLIRPGTGISFEGGYQISYEIYDGIYYTLIATAIIYALASLFGVVGSITQNRKMIRLFKVFYWIVVILQLIMSIALLVTLGVRRDVILANCASYYQSDTLDFCSNLYRNIMIGISCVLAVANVIQFYFATAVSAYATRLRRTTMHEKLRNLEDFPEPPSKPEFF